MNQVKGKRLIRYRIGVYAVVSSEQSGQKWFVGEFVTCAPSERKAVSNLRFRYRLRDYDEGNAEVSYMFEFREKDVIVGTKEEEEEDDVKELFRTIDGEKCILTDGGTYEVIDN